MNIIDVPIEELKPYEHNPRNNKRAVQAVSNSIKEFGFKVPIVIGKDYTIICGHTRYEAAKKLQLKTVPCVIADNLSEEEEKAFRIADNKIQEKSEWDVKLLGEELEDILSKYNMKNFGFEDTEIELLIKNNTEENLPQKDKQSDTQCAPFERIIIAYNSQDIDELKTMLHETGELKAHYDINEIWRHKEDADNQ